MRQNFCLGILFLIFSSQAGAVAKLEFVSQVPLAHKLKFKKSTVGGLSGLYWDTSEKKLYAICDDRGNVSEPRFYQLALTMPPKMTVKLEKVIFLSVNPTDLSHTKKRKDTKGFSAVLDMEGISRAPWGDFLITSEGDANHKPRLRPQFFSVKPDGTIMKDFDMPADYIPEASGQQKKGVQNNKAFEGLAANPSGKEWMLAIEEHLVQDPKDSVRFLQYTMPDPFVLKPGKEFKYPITEDSAVAEITYLSETKLLVLERGFQLSSAGIKTKLQFYEFDLAKPTGKSLVLDLLADPKLGGFENYEGMTIGPPFPDGKRSLIVVSDDNFMRHQVTKFLVFKITD